MTYLKQIKEDKEWKEDWGGKDLVKQKHYEEVGDV